MSSVYRYDVPYMYVRMFALLGIRLTEGCQSVGNKRAREQHLMCDLAKLFLGFRTD